MEIVEVLNTRKYKNRGYILIKNVVKGFDSQVEINSSYSWPELQYIGESIRAYDLWRYLGITEFYPSGEYQPAPQLLNGNLVERAKILLEYGHELIPFLNVSKVCNIGWSPRNQKWYGWSHRAIHDFGIGSEIKKGSVAFIPSNKEEFINNLLNFWDLNRDGSWKIFEEDRFNGFKKRLIEYNEIKKYCQVGLEITSEIVFFGKQGKRERKITKKFEPYLNKWGKGEWKAKTIDDAKQMAIDFAKSIF